MEKQAEITHEEVLGVIKYMNQVGAYATYNTVSNILFGASETNQIRSFPELKGCKYYGTITKLNCIEYSNIIDELIQCGKVTKSGFLYIANDYCNYFIGKKYSTR